MSYSERDELLVKIDGLLDALEKAEVEREALRTLVLNTAEQLGAAGRRLGDDGQWARDAATKAERTAEQTNPRRFLAAPKAALAVSPEQPERQHCTVEGDILGTGDERMNDILEGERDKAEDARSEAFEEVTQKHDDLLREHEARLAAEQRERVLRGALIKAEAVLSLSHRVVTAEAGPAFHHYRIEGSEGTSLLREIRAALGSPEQPEGPGCQVCGDKRILMEPDGSKAQPCYACQPLGMTLEKASRLLGGA